MQLAIRYLAALIAFVALSPHSYSQTLDKGLEGFTSVKIVVEDANQDSRNCGVTTASLRSAASFPVATSRLRIDERR